ncbi:MAG: DUF481 domain-containing protein [Bacteroidota bacterium]|nr:DUF481 domain-containing protein [Bacteroidota bacterium]
MPRLYFFLSILLIDILCCTGSYAQIINIDKTDTSAYQKKSQWNASFSIGLELDKQNTTLLDMSNFADASLQHYHELFILSASNRITSNGDKSFLNTGYVHLRWRHNYKNRLHPESYVQYQWDEQRGMLHRFVTGANIRYSPWHKDKWNMTFATGIMYENEAWDYAAVDSAKIPANPVTLNTSVIKSNNYVKWESQVSANSTISIILFYQALYTHFFQPRVSTFISYDATVSRHFSLGLKYTALYDVKPIVPLPNFYYSLSTNLAYKL